MKLLTYTCVFILVALSGFTIFYLYGGGKDQLANISRFTQPKEIKSIHDLLDKLPAERGGQAVLDKDGQSLLYYNVESGDLHKIVSRSEFQNQTLERLQPYLRDLRWSTDRTKILAYDSTGTTYYDLNTGTSKKLPQNIHSPVFSPSGDEFAYIYAPSPEEGSYLVVADTDLESFKKILPTSGENWSLIWPEANTLSLSYTKDGKTSLFTVDPETKQLTRAINSVDSLEINWSKDGQSLLYSYVDKTSSTKLAYKNNRGLGNEIILPVATSASECAWSANDETIFCSVPSSSASTERFISIQLTTGLTKNLHLNTAINIKTEQLFISADEKYLFFKNSYTGNFYRLQIELD